MFFAASEQQYTLGDCIGDVEKENRASDDTVEGSRRSKIKQAINTDKDEGGDGGPDGETQAIVDFGEIRGKWHTTLCRGRQSALTTAYREDTGTRFTSRENAHNNRPEVTHWLDMATEGDRTSANPTPLPQTVGAKVHPLM